MSQETINFLLSVNPSVPALLVVDASGNVLADGASITLQPETVGVVDPGQTLFTVSKGVVPYNFALASGSIPTGDTLTSTQNADGSETVTIEGTPTTAGASSFAVTISDSAGNSVTVNAKKAIN